MNAPEAYAELVRSLKETETLESVNSILSWDEETYMPQKGAEHRAAQSAMLAGMVHERFTAPRIGELLDIVGGSELAANPEGDAAAIVRETRREYDREKKLPVALVEEMTRTRILAHQAWVDARAKKEYAVFLPWLTKTIDLQRQAANCYGYTGHIYNALLDAYEPGETTDNIARVFESLRGPLVELVGKIMDSGKKAPLELLQRKFAVGAQEKFAKAAATKIGFDFSAGRLDLTAHPFCATIGPGDCRLTTRYNEHDFSDGFFSVLHEAGHGLYEQGLPAGHFGTPLGEAVSLGIHESQSRMWENLVGRGRAFWQHFLPKAKSAFRSVLKDVELDQWLFAINSVQPSLIRTEADETTYNLHVLLRFELEQSMLTGDLAPADIPAAWNERMAKYLGIKVPDDSQGALQDVHWSHGSIGYFPTYTLGNLCAAQFYEQAKQEIPGLEDGFARGNFAPLLTWLREKIHRHGRRYTARQLIHRVTGKGLSSEPLLRHLSSKAAELYGVA